MRPLTRPLMALALLALVVPASTALAQRDAGSKIRGEYNFYGNSAGSAMRSARDHSNYYRQYAQSATGGLAAIYLAHNFPTAIDTVLVAGGALALFGAFVCGKMLDGSK